MDIGVYYPALIFAVQCIFQYSLVSAYVCTNPYTIPTRYTTGLKPISVTVAHFRNDTELDIAVANQNDNTISLLLGNGDGTFQTRIKPFSGSGPRSVISGDFNN